MSEVYNITVELAQRWPKLWSFNICGVGVVTRPGFVTNKVVTNLVYATDEVATVSVHALDNIMIGSATVSRDLQWTMEYPTLRMLTQ